LLQRHNILNICSKTVAVAVDLRKPVYGRVICKSIDYNQVLGMMTKVNWEVKDIMCEHSGYVDYFLQVCCMKYENLIFHSFSMIIMFIGVTSFF